VLCTNPQFAQILAQANGVTAKPGAQHMTVEVWAPLTALLLGGLVVISWIKVGAPEGTAVASAAKAATASAPTPGQPSQPRRPAPATAPTAKKH
jgi:hypothetical protein